MLHIFFSCKNVIANAALNVLAINSKLMERQSSGLLLNLKNRFQLFCHLTTHFKPLRIHTIQPVSRWKWQKFRRRCLTKSGTGIYTAGGGKLWTTDWSAKCMTISVGTWKTRLSFATWCSLQNRQSRITNIIWPQFRRRLLLMTVGLTIRVIVTALPLAVPFPAA